MVKLLERVESSRANGRCSILAVVLTTTLDSRELKFLIRQIDEYIQVTEFMIRKTPTLDEGELALARRLRTKLTPGKHTEQEQTAPRRR
jgi:hypothetical protein